MHYILIVLLWYPTPGRYVPPIPKVSSITPFDSEESCLNAWQQIGSQLKKDSGVVVAGSCVKVVDKTNK